MSDDRRTRYRVPASRLPALASLVLIAGAAGAQTSPTPVDVPVTSVPITVTSTEADYFVLYVKHALSETDVRHVPVSLTKGKAGSTPLTMAVPGLAAARYKVEKYQVANPADVDGDGKDDLTDPNPLSSAPDLALKDGLNLLSTTTEWNALEFDAVAYGCTKCGFFASGTTYVKIVAYPGGNQPHAYFMNAPTHGRHPSFVRNMNLSLQGLAQLEIDRQTGMPGVDADVTTYYFWFTSQNEARTYARMVPILHSLLSASMPIMAAEATKWRLAYYIPDDKWWASSVRAIKEYVPGYEQAGITVLTDRSFAPDYPEISVSGGPTITEGQKAVFTLTVTEAQEQDLTLRFGIGRSNRNFVALGPRSVTLPKSETSVDWSFQTVNRQDGGTNITLSLHSRWPPWNRSANQHYFLGSPRDAFVKVLNNNEPEVSLAVADNPVEEGQPTEVQGRLTIAAATELTIPLVVTAGSAEAGDYTAPTSVTIAKGHTSGTASLATTADLDLNDETLTVAIDKTHLPAGVRTGSPSSVTLTIADLTPVVSLAVADNPVEEGESTTVEAKLTKAWPTDLAIPLVATAGSAEADDYTAPASVTIAKGETSGTASLATTADLDLNDETLTVAIDKANLPAGVMTGSPSSASLTIADLTPVVSLAMSDNPVEEGESTNVEAKLTKAWSTELTIPLVATAGSAEAGDYTAPASVTIAKGETSGTASLATTADLDLNDETLTVAIDKANLPAGVMTGSPAAIDLVIRDTTPTTAPEVTIEVNPASIDEGESATVTARLARALPDAVTIPLTVTADSAEPEDYDPPASVTIPAAGTSGTTTFDTKGDHDTESETLTLSLGALPAEVQAGTPSSVEVTITDTTASTDVSLAVTPNPVTEGSAATVTATLSAALGRPVTIPLVTTAGSAENGDFATPQTVTVPAGETSGSAVLTTADDGDEDDETLTVSLGSPLPPGLRPGTPASVAVTIGDPDEAVQSPPGPQPPPGPPPPAGPSGTSPPPPPPGPQPPPGTGSPPPPPAVNAMRADFTTAPRCERDPCRVWTGAPVLFTDLSPGTVRSRRWDLGDGAASTARSLAHVWRTPGFYEVSLTVSDGARESAATRVFLVEADQPQGACAADEYTRCLRNSRFAVTAAWSDGNGDDGDDDDGTRDDGQGRNATVVPAGTNDSGLFSFFDPANWEILVKVLDGCKANGHVWVFAASTTNLESVVRMEDTVTGETREYRNAPGAAASAVTDNKAFQAPCQGPPD